MSDFLRVGVLLSGSGRTLDNFLHHIEGGHLDASLVAVASDREGVRGLEIARDAGFPARCFPRTAYPDRRARDATMLAWLRGHEPQCVALAGYLSLLDLSGLGGLPVLNIHPALLPRHGGKGYYGDKVHAAVLASGDDETGATVHLVNERFDDGAILARVRVPVRAGDDVHALAARVFAAECELYPAVLQWLATGELRIMEGAALGTDGPWTAREIALRRFSG